MKKIIVFSLGGSLIIPEKINIKLLENFKKTLKKFYKTHKFIIVAGGGSIARKYIEALKKEHKSEKALSIAGIRATRMNALFLIQFFGKEANEVLPLNMKEVKSNLNKNAVVISGALRYTENTTSDSTAAKLAHFLKTDFINLTDVPGLFTKNPKEHKNAKLISRISWKDFAKTAKSIKYEAGEHFVLDQKASEIIKENKIPTYILGPDMKNLHSLLNGKSFIGTSISN